MQRPPASSPARRGSTIAGWLLVAAGLLNHRWALERLLAEDERIEWLPFQAGILALQLGCLVAGALWVRRPLRSRRARLAVLGIAGAAAVAGAYGNLRTVGILDPHRLARARWVELNDSEELIIEITPTLDRLAQAARDLRFPGPSSGEHLEAVVQLSAARLRPARDVWRYGQAEIVHRQVVAGPTETLPAGDAAPWSSLLAGVEFFRQAAFRVHSLRFTDPARRRFETEVEFSGLARTTGGRWAWLRLEQRVGWRRQPEGRPRIASWLTHSGSWLETDRLFFAEVLDRAVPAKEDLERARRSEHEDLLREHLLDPDGGSPFPSPALPGLTRHPGLAVVDLDRDGFDDLYVLVRWGDNLFFHNRGDGTFAERAAELGLAVRDHSSSAVFADFDNDGDADVVIGRTLAPSLYLVNEGGRFGDHSSDGVDGSLPCLVSALSAADYDGDGLLDLYAATYAGDIERHVLRQVPLDLGDCLRPGRHGAGQLALPQPRRPLRQDLGAGAAEPGGGAGGLVLGQPVLRRRRRRPARPLRAERLLHRSTSLRAAGRRVNLLLARGRARRPQRPLRLRPRHAAGAERTRASAQSLLQRPPAQPLLCQSGRRRLCRAVRRIRPG